MPCAEITFRTDAVEESIRRITAAFPEMLIGAGTVLTAEQVIHAMDAGAKFIVTPGFDPEIVDQCIRNGIPVFPGCVTPSDISQAYKRGLKNVKFFSAEQNGGVKTIRALGAPFPGIRFIPTGGVNEQNIRDYLSEEKVLVCVGIWMVKSSIIRAGGFEQITEMVRDAVKVVSEMRIRR